MRGAKHKTVHVAFLDSENHLNEFHMFLGGFLEHITLPKAHWMYQNNLSRNSEREKKKPRSMYHLCKKRVYDQGRSASRLSSLPVVFHHSDRCFNMCKLKKFAICRRHNLAVLIRQELDEDARRKKVWLQRYNWVWRRSSTWIWASKQMFRWTLMTRCVKWHAFNIWGEGGTPKGRQQARHGMVELEKIVRSSVWRKNSAEIKIENLPHFKPSNWNKWLRMLAHDQRGWNTCWRNGNDSKRWQ